MTDDDDGVMLVEARKKMAERGSGCEISKMERPSPELEGNAKLIWRRGCREQKSKKSWAHTFSCSPQSLTSRPDGQLSGGFKEKQRW